MNHPDFKPKILSVSQLNFYVKSLLSDDALLSGVFVTGEISNLVDHYSSGHIYFSLKDKGAVIKCVMFAGFARSLKFRPEEGMKVIAVGRVSLYEKTGTFQFYVEGMQPDGVGALTIAFNQLKDKLEKKGLFDPARKKRIPEFPQKIGVITSPTGAVFSDIKNVISRRFPHVEIILCPVLVQGDGAAEQLVTGVNLFNEYDLVDVIIIGRGGGSIEDLWAFNDENLAYAIYASNIPVISAVGHETDFTICDFVSDLRAPTPSAAAELAVPDRREILARLDNCGRRLPAAVKSNLSATRKVLDRNSMRLVYTGKYHVLPSHSRKLEQLAHRGEKAVEKIKSEQKLALSKLEAKLDSLRPEGYLERGFAVVESENIRISSVKELKSGDEIIIRLKDGSFTAKVEKI